jgi:DNA-binding CsgD family transcriptional regulator
MARIIFLPDDQTVIMLESPLNAEELELRVARGEWLPPDPYTLVAGEPGQIHLRALTVGQLVVVMPLRVEQTGKPKRARKSMREISPRQTEVLQLLAEGMTTKEIAAAMGVSPRTVIMHIHALKTRFGTVTREQAVMRAASLGIYSERPRKDSESP